MSEIMSSSRAYLLRALHEWILDNGCTSYILVDAAGDGVQVPKDYVENGRIVLNISPSAIRHLEISNEAVSLDARFSGQSQLVYVPIEAVLAIYAKENGHGMMFDGRTDPGGPAGPTPNGPSSHSRSPSAGDKPKLKLVK